MKERTDTERLDWLEKNIRRTPIAMTWEGFGFSSGYCVLHQASTLKGAIDAAMDAEERG